MSADTIKQIEFLSRAPKAPRIRDAASRLAEQAGDAGWSHEGYLAAVLDRQTAHDASGAQLRIHTAAFPSRKTLDDFIFDHQPAPKRDQITSAGPLPRAGPQRRPARTSRYGKIHLAIGLGIKAAHAGHRVLFGTAVD